MSSLSINPPGNACKPGNDPWSPLVIYIQFIQIVGFMEYLSTSNTSKFEGAVELNGNNGLQRIILLSLGVWSLDEKP